ncbi:MAG: carboxypeptidase regulatory-like domain-containing protein [candidate division Zixibacteria bacterium]|nr:carboxypeptidase regulatory-like domain-containing protein [candidate division Zixibacteria bacterium]
MVKIRGACFSLFLIIILLAAGCARKPAVIKGTVTDEEGSPLAGAAVFSIPQKYSVLTDTLGNFIIDGIEPGQYSLLAKLGDDSTVVNLGLIEPGQVLVTTVIIKEPPPPPPKPEKPIKPPKKKVDFIDPIKKTDIKVLLLADKEHFKKFEIESSDGLIWEYKKAYYSKLRFKGGILHEGYFPGPNSKYFETAARRCIYGNKTWIYSHGPERTPEDGREIYITIPIDLPGNIDIDSLVISYGFPRFPKNVPDGSLKFRLVGETSSGGISILIDWEKIDHSSNGSFYKKAVPTLGDNRKLQYISLEINSNGSAVWDAFLIRPLVYFSVK